MRVKLIYLDNAATTKPFKEHKFNLELFFNPSSAYATDRDNYIFKVKKIIADELITQPKNIIFTSGGTEANNLAIKGFTKKRGSKVKIAYLGFEHKSIINSIKSLEKRDYKTIKIDYKLFLNNKVEKIVEILKNEEISFLILSHIYSESGIILPITTIIKAIKKEIPKLYIHIDAVQSFMKKKISLDIGIDSISISAHKIHGIKGVGALILKNNQNIAPLIVGGKQNNGLRAGTENMLGIYSFELAIIRWQKNREQFNEKLDSLRDYFNNKFDNLYKTDKLIKVTPNNSSHIITLAVKDLFAEHIIRFLESKEIFISSGSACNNQKDLPKFLKYMNISKRYHNGVLRISFSIFNTEKEIDQLFIALDEAFTYF